MIKDGAVAPNNDQMEVVVAEREDGVKEQQALVPHVNSSMQSMHMEEAGEKEDLVTIEGEKK